MVEIIGPSIAWKLPGTARIQNQVSAFEVTCLGLACENLDRDMFYEDVIDASEKYLSYVFARNAITRPVSNI